MAQQQLVDILRGAGFKGDALRTAYAIAMAESGGNPRGLNDTRPDLSYGLFQVNMIDRLGPSRRQQFGLSSNEDLYDPATNARAAYAISGGGTNWKPWTTYTSGAYRKYLDGQQAAAVSQDQPAADAGRGTTVATTAAPQASDPRTRLASMLLSRSMQRRGSTISPLLQQLLTTQRSASTAASATPAPAGAATLPSAPAGAGAYPYNPLRTTYKPLGAPGQGTHSHGEGPDNPESDQAWDYGAPAGTPVYATFAGTIGDQYGPLASSGRFGGDRLHVLGADGREAYYAHLADNLAVRPGDQVKEGQLLGYIGQIPGLANHLHYADFRRP